MGTRRRSCAVTRSAESVARGVYASEDVRVLAAALPDAVAAERLAARLLCADPGRLRHVRTAGAVALLVADCVPERHLDLLLAATVLHDIGYAPQVRDSGFHPLDGARWLLANGADPRVAGAVGHHSEALALAATAEHRAALSALAAPPQAVADVITYADQTTAPDGRRIDPVRRVVDRRRRKPPADAAQWAVERRRTERLLHAVARVEVRLIGAGGRDPFLHGPAAAEPARSGGAQAEVDEEHLTAVLRALPAPGPHDDLEQTERARAALLAARSLAHAGPEPYYADVVRTALRLLEPAPSAVVA